MGLVIYTDESGTHDNRYMVICALITKNDKTRMHIKRRVERRIATLRKNNHVDELHASKLRTSQKQNFLLRCATNGDYELAYIVVDKHNIESSELRARPNLCFNYVFKILFRSIILNYPDQDIQVIADNRNVSAGSKNSLPEYIMTEAYAKWGYTGTLSVQFCDSRDVKGLQAVDIMANAIYAKYNLNKDHLYQIHSAHYIETIQFPRTTFGT